jgi:hypothetical protein
MTGHTKQATRLMIRLRVDCEIKSSDPGQEYSYFWFLVHILAGRNWSGYIRVLVLEKFRKVSGFFKWLIPL